MTKTQKSFFLSLALGASLAIPATVLVMQQPGHAEKQEVAKGERAKHPRLDKALKDLNETIAYLEKAPDNFGGHKKMAIDSCKQAKDHLKMALEHAGKN
ncbi:MAG: hypothetical protein IV090_25565 [Candidatus Sericytochromatia bacterium]|nr:hypothetical protein [Candidatus Sericytochromatia bacterium]